ncbi:putative hydroxypyruvate isomerase isoform X5 [Castor canadensis]|uniref:Hydroxypyruvate isomerase isoform X5 n=1 Tax=Castor canadensis TaxID=51338 RepID=A0AC58N4B8_CASCN
MGRRHTIPGKDAVARGNRKVSWEGPEGRSSKYRTGIHLMAGRVPQGADRAAVRGEMETVFLENLKYAAGVLAQVRGRNVGDQLRHETGHWLMPEGQMSMLVSDWLMGDKCGSSVHCIQHGARRTSWECWNPLTPGSRTPSTSWIHPSRDIFHWQIMDGNLTGNIREFLPIVGHVQVAQVPGRGEPGSSGELDFSYLFQLLEDEGYEGFVGCEYKPQGDTIAGLSWLRSYWDRRGHPQDGR